MITELMDVGAVAKAQAEEIISTGADIRRRLAEVVTRNAGESRQSGGFLALVRAAADGAGAGFARSVPRDPDAALRQVVDALGDGVTQTALAARLALEEAAGASRHYRDEDLARLRDDLTAARDLFAETIDRGLSAGKALTAGQLAAARRHAERVADRLGPAVGQALDALRQHPVEVAREGLDAGFSAGRSAAGSLFQALSRTLRPAGDQGHPGRQPPHDPERP